MASKLREQMKTQHSSKLCLVCTVFKNSAPFLSKAEYGGGQEGQQLQRIVGNDQVPEVQQLSWWKVAGESPHDPAEDDLKSWQAHF